jgi:beta-glucosidase
MPKILPKMTVEQMAGLMLYSRHQAIPAQEQECLLELTTENHFQKSGAKSSDLSDQQVAFLTKETIYVMC